jgi:hypothetical protein
MGSVGVCSRHLSQGVAEECLVWLSKSQNQAPINDKVSVPQNAVLGTSHDLFPVPSIQSTP